MEEKVLLCDCGSEMLLCNRDEEYQQIYVAIYSYGQYRKKPGLWERIKYCWYHLRTGKKYEDQMIFTFEKAKELGEWLINNSSITERK